MLELLAKETALKDKAYRKQKKRAEAFWDKWAPQLGAKWWTICHHWHDEPYTGEGDGRTPAARTKVDWDYSRACVNFYLPEWTDFTDADAERVVIHEILHILVNEMRQWQDASDALRHEERVVTALAQAFLWTRDAAKEGKL